jgi:hypothetical protein
MISIKPLLILPIICIFFNCILFSQTTINTQEFNGATLKTTKTINGNITWKDTVIVDTNITIQKDSSLTIDAGGKITANGTAKKPILFSVNDTSGYEQNDNGEGGWGGIYIQGSETSPKSELKYCTIEFCKKIYDELSDNGGAITAKNHQNIEIINCVIRNSKAFHGGGLYFKNSKVKIMNCEMYFNQSLSGSGGALFIDNSETTIINNIFHHNISKTRGGAIFINSDESILINNTICYNTAITKGGGITFFAGAKIYNTIIYYNIALEDEGGNQGYIYYDVLPSFYNCDIEQGLDGIQNENTDFLGIYESGIESPPMFVRADTFNYGIISLSPCVDAGNHEILDFDFDKEIPYDIEGNYRRAPHYKGNERIVDIGAYEYNAPAPLLMEYEIQNESMSGKYDGSITLFISEGQPPYTILWNTGDTISKLTNLKSGLYSVTVSDEFNYVISETFFVNITTVIPNLPTQFSVRGKVYKQDTLVGSGMVLAFKKGEKSILLDTLSKINKGTYLLNNLDSASYIILAIPTPGKHDPYLPTYYSSYTDWKSADEVNVNGQIYDLDVRLFSHFSNELGNRSISGNVIYEDTTSFLKSLFNNNWFETSTYEKSEVTEKAAQNIPVILKKGNNIVSWSISDENGYFEFLNIPNGLYSAEAQKAGLSTTFSPDLVINDDIQNIENLKIIIRKNDIITTYNNNYNDDFKYEVNLYPSLSSNKITIDFNYYDLLDYAMYIYDAKGRLISSDTMNKPEGDSKQNLDVAMFALGCYWVKIVIDNQVILKKFVKF